MTSTSEALDGTGLVGNVYRGSSGVDNIPEINQAQLIYGGASDDVINGGNSGTGETIYGGSGNDKIFGNNGADTLYGGSGNDVIVGGNASDEIIGGWGADTPLRAVSVATILLYIYL